MITATASDDTDQLQLTWFNQPYMEKSLTVGQDYRFAGEPEFKFGKFQMTSPTHELASKPMVHTGRIVPIYPLTAGVTSKWLRARIAPLLPKVEVVVPEFLPDAILSKYDLASLPEAIRHLHAPETMEQAGIARRRLAFNELLLLQLASLQRKMAQGQSAAAPALRVGRKEIREWVMGLPFDLTEAQQKVIDEITTDLAKSQPMNRLVEGDVGSGKTVVAAAAALAAAFNGYQTAVMAPTSVLAQQHYQTFQALLEGARVRAGEAARRASQTLDEETKPEGRELRPVSVALRTAKSKMPPADITIGTHALIASGVEFEALGLVIIDEQHRFGVAQRAELMSKAGHGVHLLSMTATPIPRTLALTAYGDLDLSIIDQMPANRLPIKTHVVPEHKRADMEDYLDAAMARGEQVFIVCPLIDESDKVTEVRAATAEFERLQQVFGQRRLALLHGRMKAADKDQILAEFKNHQFDALVATPVVEVGIDVPNATMLVIEGAERFGLAQLHQLRGRVGRGDKQSYCFLLSDAKKAKDIARLRHMEHESSGIALAELDLATRGPGEVYGHRQSGIPELKAASFMDVELTQTTHEAAEGLIASLNSYPNLERELSRTQKLVEMN